MLLPLAILEALSASLPCAITPNLMAEMPFLNEENSIAIGEDERWAAVLSDRARLRELGENGRRLAEREFSFDLMAERYERRSLVITSNLVFSEWDRIFKNPMTTAAAIDRLVHHATIL